MDRETSKEESVEPSRKGRKLSEVSKRGLTNLFAIEGINSVKQVIINLEVPLLKVWLWRLSQEKGSCCRR